MWRLIRFRASAHDERGAAALLMAILIPAVFLGVGALVLNVGGWYVARGMDQNGADAGAVAVAQLCAKTSCDQGSANAEAAKYADDISKPNGSLAGQATFVCGTLPGLTNACNSANENGKICPLPPASGAKYVDVLVAPKGGEMNNLTTGKQAIAACAQATISGPATCEGCTALTISACEWNMNTAGGTVFAEHAEGTGYSDGSPPSYVDTINKRLLDPRYNATVGNNASNIYVTNGVTDPQNTSPGADIAGSETVLYTKGPPMPGCGEAGNGANAPGNFGWLDDDDDNCIAADPTAGTGGASSGAQSEAACKQLFTESRDNATPIYLPVYESTAGTGENTTYTLAGFAAFVVTGWNFSGTLGAKESVIAQADSGKGSFTGGPHPTDYCGKPTKGYVPTGDNSPECLTGYFTKALVSADEIGGGGGGGDDLGLTIVSLTG